MIELNRHIALLLLDNECVILPGMGGFVTYAERARYDDDTQTWYPPFRSVGFNSHLKVNDGLLVQSLMQVYDVDYAEATRMLEEAVDDVRKRILSGGEWVIDSVGTLSQGPDGAYLFSLCGEGGIASPAHYGLDSLELSAHMTVAEDKADPESPVMEAEPLSGEETYVYEDDTPSLWSRYGKRILKYAAIFAGVIFLFLATSVPVSNVRTAGVDVSQGAMYVFPVGSAWQNIRRDINRMQAASHPVTPVAEDTMASEPAREATPVAEHIADSVLPRYTIVLASRVKRSNAENLVAELSRKGLPDGEVMVKGKMTRVVYSSYASESEAYNALHELRLRQSGFEEAWVMPVPD